MLPAAAGVVLGWSLKPTPTPTFRTVTVPDAELAKRVPRVTPTLGERITKMTVKPTQVATSQGTPDTATIGALLAGVDVGKAAAIGGGAGCAGSQF